MNLNLIAYTEINSKLITNLKVKCKTINLLEENVRKNLHDLALGKQFLNITRKE